MIGKIETAHDIDTAKERLEAEAEMHKQQLKRNFATLQNQVTPVNIAKNVVRSQYTPEILKYTADIGAFVLINKVLPKRTAWILKLVIPFFANRYLNRYIDRNYITWSYKLTQAIDKSEQKNTHDHSTQALVPPSTPVIVD